MSPAVVEDLMVAVKESIQRQHLTAHPIQLHNVFSSFIFPYFGMCIDRIRENEEDSRWMGIKTGFLVSFDGYEQRILITRICLLSQYFDEMKQSISLEEIEKEEDVLMV